MDILSVGFPKATGWAPWKQNARTNRTLVQPSRTLLDVILPLHYSFCLLDTSWSLLCPPSAGAKLNCSDNIEQKPTSQCNHWHCVVTIVFFCPCCPNAMSKWKRGTMIKEEPSQCVWSFRTHPCGEKTCTVIPSKLCSHHLLFNRQPQQRLQTCSVANNSMLQVWMCSQTS